MSFDDDDPSPPAIWNALRYFLECLAGFFGDPAALARRRLLTRADHDALSGWLRPIEQILRRLLLVEAAASPKPALAARRPSAPRPRRPSVFNPAHPESWRVSLRFEGPPASSRQSRRKPAAPAVQGALASTPLAKRLEAIRRVLENPALHIARAARRFHRRPALAGPPHKAPAQTGARSCNRLVARRAHAANANGRAGVQLKLTL